jgi:hypothetical protein
VPAAVGQPADDGGGRILSRGLQLQRFRPHRPLHQDSPPGGGRTHRPRVSFETSFDSKQPKLEPKLVSAVSKTKRLFRLFRFYTETESFDISIEPKQTKDQPKQFDIGSILCYFLQKILCFPVFSFFSHFSGLFRFEQKFIFVCLKDIVTGLQMRLA